jgi:glycosyltransferase involved in cell wall biosynthesis
VRIAIAYDCLFPNTVGGAERWYRNLAVSLMERHEVTYLTRRQWESDQTGTPFATLAVSPGSGLYARSGRRRIWPPIRFGLGVFLHLLRHGHRYDVVHTASFPYFHVIGAALALWLRRSSARLIVDWHEVWGRDYWRRYLGPTGGPVGFLVQRLCLRAPDHSFTFSRLATNRLHELGHRAPVTRLTGEYVETAPSGEDASITAGSELVVFAGRHIPEKRVLSIPPAIAAARARIPTLRCVILGDGPDTERARELVAELGLRDAIEIRGRVDPEEVAALIGAASCVLHPSEREGYGLVVIEAVARSTPVVLVEGPENAATELIEPGINGELALSAEAEELGGAVVRVIEAGDALRCRARDWYERHREELSIGDSLARVETAYVEPDPASAG